MGKLQRKIRRVADLGKGSSSTPLTEPPPTLSEAEKRLRVRSMMPVELDYDPFADSASMKRFLGHLTDLVLQGRIHHRAASACRLLVLGWVAVDEHERMEALERRIEELEKMKQQ